MENRIEIRIGERLQELRKESGITQEGLASILGVTTRTIQKWESGETFVKAYCLDKLSTTLNVSVDYILCLTDYRHVDNEVISQVTGLSEESVEVLRVLNSCREHTANNAEKENFLSLKCLNLILEDMHADAMEHKRDSFKFVESLLYKLWSYVFSGGVTVNLSAYGVKADEANKNSLSTDSVVINVPGDSVSIHQVSELYRQVVLKNIVNKLDSFVNQFGRK